MFGKISHSSYEMAKASIAKDQIRSESLLMDLPEMFDDAARTVT